MDLDVFVAVLRTRLDARPVPLITSLEDLDNAVDFLNDVLLAALEDSTPHHRPCSMAKRWWSPTLTQLRKAMRNRRRTYQRTLVPGARSAWLTARRTFYQAISQAKIEIWITFVKELERVDIYKVLKRLKERRSAVFPSISDPASGDIALSHVDRGRVLGRAWFGLHAVELTQADKPDYAPLSPFDVTSTTRADQSGSGDRRKRGGVHTGAMPLGELPPPADRQDPLPASHNTSEPPLTRPDPRSLAETIPIPHERTFTPPTDTEIDNVIMSSAPWKAPDRYGIQMGFIQRGYSVLREWIRPVFRASVILGAKPTAYKANVATPVHKAGKKDKTSPKAWRPVENFEHALAKPLERLVADRISFKAESLGFIENAQYGGRPGHSTLQAVDGYIHRVRKQLDEGHTVSTLLYDLKGAFNRISH
jgi:hypothetical protein